MKVGIPLDIFYTTITSNVPKEERFHKMFKTIISQNSKDGKIFNLCIIVMKIDLMIYKLATFPVILHHWASNQKNIHNALLMFSEEMPVYL